MLGFQFLEESLMNHIINQNPILADEVGLLLGEVVAVHLRLAHLNYFGQ